MRKWVLDIGLGSLMHNHENCTLIDITELLEEFDKSNVLIFVTRTSGPFGPLVLVFYAFSQVLGFTESGKCYKLKEERNS